MSGYKQSSALVRLAVLSPAQHRRMSNASITFTSSISDATTLLGHFDALNKLNAETAEVLKRAGLVMALTAWETYVEDRASEAVGNRLKALCGSPIGAFVNAKLAEDLKRFHNPNSEKTRKLFLDYLQVDVYASWKWLNYDIARVKKTLDDLISRRGDAVHRSKPVTAGASPAHLVKREDLDKAIRFLISLVDATEIALGSE